MKTDRSWVTVQEGNTELADDTLVVFGYDVSGRVTSEEEAVSGVSFVLFGVRISCIFVTHFRYIFNILSLRRMAWPKVARRHL